MGSFDENYMVCESDSVSFSDDTCASELDSWDDAAATTSSSSSLSSSFSSNSNFSNREFLSSPPHTLSPEETSNGPLYELSGLMAHLPIKRGLSRHYQGKSQSFKSLSKVCCLEDLAKKTTPYNRKKLKSCKSCGDGFEDHSRKPYTPRTCNKIITKKPFKKKSCSAFITTRPPPICNSPKS